MGFCFVFLVFQFHPELVFLNVIVLNELNCDTFIYCTALYTVFLLFSIFNLIIISCMYLALTPNSRTFFRAGVS